MWLLMKEDDYYSGYYINGYDLKIKFFDGSGFFQATDFLEAARKESVCYQDRLGHCIDFIEGTKSSDRMIVVFELKSGKLYYGYASDKKLVLSTKRIEDFVKEDLSR